MSSLGNTKLIRLFAGLCFRILRKVLRKRKLLGSKLHVWEKLAENMKESNVVEVYSKLWHSKISEMLNLLPPAANLNKKITN